MLIRFWILGIVCNVNLQHSVNPIEKIVTLAITMMRLTVIAATIVSLKIYLIVRQEKLYLTTFYRFKGGLCQTGSCTLLVV